MATSNTWTEKSWSEYYIAPGAGRKLYVLRNKGANYWIDNYGGERISEFDHRVRTLGKNLEEAKEKADGIVGEGNYVIHEAELRTIVHTEDERRHFRFPNGKFSNKDVAEMDLAEKSVLGYVMWWWNKYKSTKSYTKFHVNLEALLKERGLLVEHNGELYSKRDYENMIRREAWKKEAEEQAAGSEYVGEAGEKIELEMKLIFEKAISETQFGTFWITKYVDRGGNTILKKGGIGPEMEKGEWYKVRATVKGHTTYKEEKQTLVIRLKILEELKTAAVR